MSAQPAAHPSIEVLRAFALGKTSFVPAEVVAAHLAACPDCQKIVAGLPGDNFADRVKHGHPTVSLPTPDPLGETRHSLPDSQSFPPPNDAPPELAGHPDYEIQRKLGEGGMGVVFLARNKLMDRLEVLKVINQSSLGRDGAAERFLQEIRSAARLHHPNVVTAYAATRLGDLLVLAMEYVDGVDLAKMVRQKGPLPIPHACHYARQVALGLQQAFDQGLVHRDIKPNNLILGRKSVVKILDFGLAKVRQEEGETGLTSANVMMGTPEYMAPEQWSDARSADIRADIYSLGCTLYYLLTGRPPFVVKNSAEAVAAHTLKQPRPVNELRPEVPAGLVAVVARMLAKDPAIRYQTPAEVARALAPFIKGEAKPPPPPASDPTVPQPQPPRPPEPRPGSGRKVGMWVAGALAGLLLLLLFFALPFFFPATQTNPDTTKAADLARKQENQQPPAPGRQPLPGEVIAVALSPGVEMKFAWVPPGESWLGGGGGKPGTNKYPLPQGLWCGVYPVTQAEWQAVMGDNPSHFKSNPRYPVETVSWNDVQRFLEQLNQQKREEGLLYRLPTEEEWEYICRGGPLSKDQSKYHFYFARSKADPTSTPSNDLSSTQANFNGNYPAGSAAKGSYLQRPCDVGLYLPNPLGIYDLHGNVWEWTSSVYEGGSARVIRGGCWRNDAADCAASYRGWLEPDDAGSGLGFRLLAVPTR